MSIWMNWIPVGDQLPDDDMTVLIGMRPGKVCTGYRLGNYWFNENTNERMNAAKVTHWQRLPPPPEYL